MLQKLPAVIRPLWRTYLGILLPMMLTNVLQTASGAIDGIYLGQLLGVRAVAAVSAFFPVMFFLLAIVIGLSSGATVLIGQAWGAGERQKVRAIAGTALGMMGIAACTMGLAGALFATDILRGLGTPPAVQQEAANYARLFLLGLPVIFTLWLVTSMSRGVGDAVSPLKALAVAAAASLLCTPALILGWGLLPRLGVASAAVSNVVAYLIALVWLAKHWHRTGHPLAPLGVPLRIDPALAAAILRIGIPAAFQMLAMAMAEIALLKLVNRYGMGATAAYGAVNQVMSWVQLPVMSLGITASILASHAIGSGRPDRLGKIVRTGLCLNILMTGCFILAAYLLAAPLIGLFIVDGSVVATATGLLRTVLWSLLALGGASVLSGAMRSDGTVFGPTALSVFAILGIEIPAAFYFEARFGLPGIWAAYATTFVAMLILQSAFFRTVWRKRAKRRLV